MSNPKITVIMAVYNAEPYLRRCLNSLQAQTMTDFDVIVVDDGSTDQSLAIAEEYAQRDKRFRVYHKENGGVSSARQFGIERLAEQGGKYSIHVDPDDWVEPQMLEWLYQKAETTGADMVICDYYYNTKDKQWTCIQNPKSENPQIVLDALSIRIDGYLWNKLIRAACYRDAGFNFPTGLDYCEDHYAIVSLLLKSIHKVAYLPKAFYHYDNYTNSQAETKKRECEYINFTRTEIVRRCRQVIPDSMRNWQYYLFEAEKAFHIVVYGSMRDMEFKQFFHDIPLSLLLHSHRQFLRTFLVCLLIHTPLKLHHASKMCNRVVSFVR